MSKRIHVVMQDSLVERVERALGPGQSRGDWIRRAVEQALSEAKEPAMTEQASPGSVPSVEGVRLAAPAERLRLRESEIQREIAGDHRWQTVGARPSAQAKRDIQPRPKGGK